MDVSNRVQPDHASTELGARFTAWASAASSRIRRWNTLSAQQDPRTGQPWCGDWSVGKRISSFAERHYEIVGQLGRGGMGVVHLARDIERGFPVVVKSPMGRRFEDARLLNRFYAEAASWFDVGNFLHIVVPFEIGEVDRIPCIFAEYCTGGSLAARLESGTCSLPVIMDIAIQIIWALQHAHAQGLVHCDLKPLNVLFETVGGVEAVKVTDFGLTRVLQDTWIAAASEQFGGTPAYMAPEQWDPHLGSVGPYTDVYALGVMLFEACYGRRPYDATTLDRYRVLHLTGSVPDYQSTLGPLPELLEAMILGCLRKHPNNRPPLERIERFFIDFYREVARTSYPRERPTARFEPIPLDDRRPDYLVALAAVLYKRGDIENADRVAARAIRLLDRIGDIPRLAAVLRISAERALESGDRERLLKALAVGEAYARDFGRDHDLKELRAVRERARTLLDTES